MTAGFVLDASVALCWFFPGQHEQEAAALLDRLTAGATAMVPAVFPLELVHALCRAERETVTDRERSDRFLALIEELQLTVDADSALPAMAFGRIVGLARRHGLSSYDATYLELAVRRRAPLATFDRRLREAAEREGLDLLGELAA